eukprot:2821689-Alexandrium_andersonii.AAC.1
MSGGFRPPRERSSRAASGAAPRPAARGPRPARRPGAGWPHLGGSPPPPPAGAGSPARAEPPPGWRAPQGRRSRARGARPR